jgi:hypothetical protein
LLAMAWLGCKMLQDVGTRCCTLRSSHQWVQFLGVLKCIKYNVFHLVIVGPWFRIISWHWRWFNPNFARKPLLYRPLLATTFATCTMMQWLSYSPPYPSYKGLYDCLRQ